MKQIVLIILSILYTTSAFAQENKNISSAFNFSYIYYKLNNEKYTVTFINKFNYEINAIGYYKIHTKFSIGLGLGFQTKDFFYTNDTPDFHGNIKYEYFIRNINFHLATSIRKIKLELINININNSIILNNIVNYKVVETSEYGFVNSINNIDVGQKSGFTYRFGIEMEKQIYHCCSLSISPFLNYKFFLDIPDKSAQMYDLNDDRVSYGVKVSAVIHL